MPKAAELKRGMIVEIKGSPHAVKKVEAKSPSSRGAATLYKIRFTNLKTGQKLDLSLKGNDLLNDIDCMRTQVQYSYADGDNHVFMDVVTYQQYELNSSDLSDDLAFLTEGLEGITAILVDDLPIAIELPQSVNLAITDTMPVIKGVSSTGRTKTASVTTGLELQVPEYLDIGEFIKIHTSDGKFISRA